MEQIEGFSRGQWLRRGTAVGMGVVSSAIAVGGLASRASSASSTNVDHEVLNLALAFEEFQSDFYARSMHSLALRGEWLQFAQVVSGHERAHVAFLQRRLGTGVTPTVRLELTRPPATIADFERLAIAFEDTGVAFYNGQAGNLTTGSLAAVAEIVSVEARHAAWARDLAGQIPAPVPTDPLEDEAQVTARLSKLGVKVG
jgi:hypothetical protein